MNLCLRKKMEPSPASEKKESPLDDMVAAVKAERGLYESPPRPKRATRLPPTRAAKQPKKEAVKPPPPARPPIRMFNYITQADERVFIDPPPDHKGWHFPVEVDIQAVGVATKSILNQEFKKVKHLFSPHKTFVSAVVGILGGTLTDAMLPAKFFVSYATKRTGANPTSNINISFHKYDPAKLDDCRVLDLLWSPDSRSHLMTLGVSQPDQLIDFIRSHSGLAPGVLTLKTKTTPLYDTFPY